MYLVTSDMISWRWMLVWFGVVCVSLNLYTLLAYDSSFFMTMLALLVMLFVAWFTFGKYKEIKRLRTAR